MLDIPTQTKPSEYARANQYVDNAWRYAVAERSNYQITFHNTGDNPAELRGKRLFYTGYDVAQGTHTDGGLGIGDFRNGLTDEVERYINEQLMFGRTSAGGLRNYPVARSAHNTFSLARFGFGMLRLHQSDAAGVGTNERFHVFFGLGVRDVLQLQLLADYVKISQDGDQHHRGLVLFDRNHFARDPTGHGLTSAARRGRKHECNAGTYMSAHVWFPAGYGKCSHAQGGGPEAYGTGTAFHADHLVT